MDWKNWFFDLSLVGESVETSASYSGDLACLSILTNLRYFLFFAVELSLWFAFFQLFHNCHIKTTCICDNHYILEILTWWSLIWYYCWSLLLCRMETLKRHLPISVPEGLNELRKIAIRFEEKIYTAATSQVYPFALMLFLPFLIEGLFGTENYFCSPFLKSQWISTTSSEVQNCLCQYCVLFIVQQWL